MPSNADSQRFRNEDLVLKVSPSVDRVKWDDSKYEAFLDELCTDREYQKNAIRTALRFLLGGEAPDLRSLARSNFDQNPVLAERYGSWEGMQRHLQFPDHLSATLDLATGTGKSFVLYGLGAILLAEGIVDRVLVLCPSTTIEAGLLDKFRDLATNTELRDLLPADARISTPSVTNASQTITEGSICVENYHAILEHVRSSIRDSLIGKGSRVAILNDETHHVANESASKAKKWKGFLLDPDFGFRHIIGVSGTCYVGNDYFADVIFRYSLRQAMEERYVKKVDYVAEMPRSGEPDEKWQLIHNRHEETRKKLKRRRITPLTIVVTSTIAKCKDAADELKGYLVEQTKITPEQADELVLPVYNNAPGLIKLPYVDEPTSKVEWITAVSMLNEGWDVKRVFQIVPHEERAFNSKLLISQVLGRGLRVPEGWTGEQPEVTVFNHDSWAARIRQLVNEILEIEKRIPAFIRPNSPHHFDLHHIDYTLRPTTVRKPMTGEYTLFAKGYVDLASETPAEDLSIEFERAGTGERYKWQTKIRHKTFTPKEVASEMFRRMQEAQDPEDESEEASTYYTDAYPVETLEQIVIDSLARRGLTEATESMKQKFLQSLGPLRRKTSETVRYTPIVDRNFVISTLQRQTDSVSAADLRRTKTIVSTDETRGTLIDEQIEFFDEVIEPGSGYKVIQVQNRHDFKTPLNAVIADSENERKFINLLLKSENIPHYEAWLKSTATRFYEIEFAWKKGEHPKRGKFSPDFFIKLVDRILIVEVKDDQELRDPAEENRKKNEYALAHFERINKHLEAEGSSLRYQFNFLTERSFNVFFQNLREGNIANFRSELDVKLSEEA